MTSLASEPGRISTAIASLVDLIPEPALLVGRDGVILHANRLFQEAVDLDVRRMVGRPLAEAVTTPVAELAQFLRQCSGARQPVPGSLCFRSEADKPLRLRANGAAMLTDEGAPGPLLLRFSPHANAVAEFSLLDERIKLLSKEIRLRRQTEDELRRSEARLRLAIAAAEMGTWDFDPITQRVTCDGRTAELFDASIPAAMEYRAFLTAIHPADRSGVDAAIQGALNSNSGADAFALEYRTDTSAERGERWIAHRGKALCAEGVGVRVIGLLLDVTEQRQAAEHQRLLINELNHRVKNTLAIVHSMAVQTVRTSTDLAGFSRSFEARLMALSQTHNLLTQTRWRGADLHEVIATELAPFQDVDENRVDIHGPTVHLSSKATIALGLAFHELTTNAVKYGALSGPGGRVRIAWEIGTMVAGRLTLGLRWMETGGPPVVPPQRRGFGSRLIERGLAHDLGGSIRLEFGQEGVTCHMDLPMDRLSGGDDDLT